MFCRWGEEPAGFRSTMQIMLSFTTEAKVQIRKTEPTISLSCQPWTPQKATDSGFPPPNLTSHSQGDGWHRAVIPSDIANLCCTSSLHTLRWHRRNLPKFRLKLPKFIVPVRGAGEGDVGDSLLQQCTLMPNLSQSSDLSPIIFLHSSDFLSLLTYSHYSKLKPKQTEAFRLFWPKS